MTAGTVGDAFLALDAHLRQARHLVLDYLGDRIGIVGGLQVPALSDLIRGRGQPA